MTNSISRRALIQRVIAGAGLGFASLSSSNIAIAQEMILASNSQSDFFSTRQSKTLKSFCDCLLPTTDTPGAVDVGVPDFIALLCQNYMQKHELDLVLSAIRSIDEASLLTFKKAFFELSQTMQTKLLVDFKNQGKTKIKQITKLRQLVLLGYFTSEKVGREVTVYLPIPGEYDPCMPLNENQGRAWTI